MKIVEGDLIAYALEGNLDVLIHGCNCFCVMDAGIALAVKRNFPEAFEADLATSCGDSSKLGGYSCATLLRNGHQFTVINAYTQFHFHGPGVLVDYDAISAVFQKVKTDFAGRRFAFPLIGAGLGKGDWTVISQIISEQLKGEDYTLVKYLPSS